MDMLIQIFNKFFTIKVVKVDDNKTFYKVHFVDGTNQDVRTVDFINTLIRLRL